MFELDQHVKDNYAALKAERGLTWEQLAEQIGTHDPNTSAWLRSQAGPSRVRRRTRLSSEEA